MSADAVLVAVVARAGVIGRAAVARAGEALAAAAEAELPGVAATAEPGRVVLTGRGLRARAFGSRRAAADPHFAALVHSITGGF